MNLEKLLEMQRVLDEQIINGKEIKLSAEELFFNTVVALDVELSEFANEGRWFKVWSDDQKPRNKVFKPYINPMRGEGGEYTNPLLEEFVDGVHFFLSIANQKGWQESMYLYEESVEERRVEGLDGGLNGAFLEMKFWLMKMSFEKSKNEFILGRPTNEWYFRTAWFIYICIGLVGFDFTPEQIEQAYIAKNEVNHKRQESGY